MAEHPCVERRGWFSFDAILPAAGALLRGSAVAVHRWILRSDEEYLNVKAVWIKTG